MFRYLPALLLAGFVLEIASIIWVGGAIGVFPTLLLLFAGGMVGAAVFRSAGSNATTVLRASVQDPGRQRNLAAATLARVFSGVLFILPGFFSDLAAVLLLLPPVQAWLGAKFRTTESFESAGYASSERRSGLIIEGEATEIEDAADLDKEDGGGRRPF
jgi:UPF0716 protein FxsA